MAADDKLGLSSELSNQVEEKLTWISTLSLTRDILQFSPAVVRVARWVSLHIFQFKSIKGAVGVKENAEIMLQIVKKGFVIDLQA